jgi:hypothetical protein
MNDLEIDKIYLDSNFVYLINNCEIDRLQTFFNFALENYSVENDQSKINSIQNIISALFGNDIESNNIYRQVKYLINKGCYNRLLKKFKNDLINLEFKESRVELILESIKNHYERIVELQKKDELNNYQSIINFEIKTEMPVMNTNFKITNDDGDFNKDLKKQNILMKFQLDKKNCDDSNKNDEILIQMDKTQLVNFYEEIEKIQEKLDLLY